MVREKQKRHQGKEKDFFFGFHFVTSLFTIFPLIYGSLDLYSASAAIFTFLTMVSAAAS